MELSCGILEILQPECQLGNNITIIAELGVGAALALFLFYLQRRSTRKITEVWNLRRDRVRFLIVNQLMTIKQIVHYVAKMDSKSVNDLMSGKQTNLWQNAMNELETEFHILRQIIDRNQELIEPEFIDKIATLQYNITELMKDSKAKEKLKENLDGIFRGIDSLNHEYAPDFEFMEENIYSIIKNRIESKE